MISLCNGGSSLIPFRRRRRRPGIHPIHYRVTCAGLLNVAGYYDPLVAMLKRAHEEGFIADNWTDLVLVADVHLPPPFLFLASDVGGGWWLI
jgi:hypothetical protein